MGEITESPLAGSCCLTTEVTTTTMEACLLTAHRRQGLASSPPPRLPGLTAPRTVWRAIIICRMEAKASTRARSTWTDTNIASAEGKMAAMARYTKGAAISDGLVSVDTR